jgi:uncharacterized repeat protein (TIGR01451 family)
MITRPKIITSRWVHCSGIMLVVFAAVLALTGLAAVQSQEAAAQREPQPASPHAANRYVAKTGVDAGACTDPLAPCATLQYAIDQAGTGDSVLVATGVYTEVNNYGGLAQVGYITKTIDLRGGYSPDFRDRIPGVYTTTLDAEGLGRVLYITGNITPTVEGFVITHGDATGLGGLSSGEDVGGGIYVITAKSTLSDCRIVNNYAYGGGGVIINSASDGLLQNNLFAMNQSYMGSGVMIILSQSILRGNDIIENAVEAAGSVSIFSASATLDNNTISHNVNSGNYVGGIHSSNSSVMMTNNRITDNEAAGVFMDNWSTSPSSIIQGNIISGNAVGFFCWNGCPYARLLDNQILNNEQGILILLSSSLTISGNTIHGNHTSSNGAGIYFFRVNDAIVTENTIIENSTQQDGGGIYVDSGSYITITKNTINGNQAGRNGGGISLDDYSEYVTVKENTISNNWASQIGGGIYSNSYYWYPPKFISNLIIHNEAGNYCGGMVNQNGGELTNNLIAENSAGIHGSGACLYRNSTLLHNTLASNSGGDGSGVYTSGSDTTINMVNTIVVSQTVGILVDSGALAVLDSTLWYSNTQNWSGSGTITATHNYTGDPGFPAPAWGNYHLSATSAAKDIGVDAGVNIDFEGDPRPQDGGFDLGFDEYLAKVDFTIHKHAIPGRVQAGDPLTFMLIFSNQGTFTATQVLITDIIPVELENYQVFSTLPVTPTGGAPYTWEVDPLAPGVGGAITITGILNGSLPEGYVFTNTAQITTTAPVLVVNRSDDFASAIVRLNTSPVAVDDEYTTLENTLLQISASGVMQNDLDAEGDALAAILDTDPVTGVLALQSDGGFTYLSPPGYYGEITFTYHLSDGLSASNSAQVLVTITPDNAPPVAVSDTYTSSEDILLQIDAPGVIQNDHDPDGDVLNAILDTNPITGALTLQPDGGFTYLPLYNYNGEITFTYRLSDGLVYSNIGLVTVNVIPVNDPPLAVDDFAATLEDTQVAVDVLANDSDVDGDLLSLSAIGQPVHGSTTISATIAVYTPAVNFFGQDVFTYTVSDGQNSVAAAVVTITVEAVNDAPIVAAGEDQIALEGEMISFSGSFTDDGQNGNSSPGAGEQYAWDFGDDLTSTGTLTPTHIYDDDGVYTVTLIVTDSEGAVGQDWLAVTTSNVAPILAGLPDQTIQIGQLVSVTGVFTDPGWLDTHEVIVEWETGISETLSLAPGGRQFELEHGYSHAGAYIVTIWVMDDDGGMDSCSFEVVVIPWRVYLPGISK